jgi:hypothetical protein
MINLSLFASNTCSTGGMFLTLPHWYQYLPKGPDGCPQFLALGDIWLIALAVIEMLLQVVVLISIAMVIYGGVQLLTSQGQPDKVGKARSTIINALIGVSISITSALLISFLAGKIG